MTRFLKLYAIGLPVFLLIDFVWLRLIARSFYQDQMGHLLRADVIWAAAVLFYLLFVVGIVLLAVWPALEHRSLPRAIWSGALLGLVAYAAYDLTNLAVLEGFPVIVAMVDMAWGAVLCASVSVITFLVARRLGMAS
jgi:uncharacterized membrane protein